MRRNCIFRKFVRTAGSGILLMLVLGCATTLLATELKQSPSYPVKTPVSTTADGTVTAVPLPPKAQKLLPNDVALYSSHGYGFWQMGQGLRHEKRLDLMPPSYKGGLSGNSSSLLRFFAMSDIHITDVQSPAQAIYFGLKPMPGMQAAYSAVIPYTTHEIGRAHV